MERAILDCTKSILKKITFNPYLFSIEVKKAMQRLMHCEKEVLKLFINRLILNNPEPSHCSVYLVYRLCFGSGLIILTS